ncbi:alanine racemase [Thalassobacillus devorans]|uniref:alanine racemase n=1 Tax=Thalassobacillus devorans TaxID=279813 RepID=UPI000A1CE7F6|nr:alanine racemase [Thalassobacillus devorans]
MFLDITNQRNPNLLEAGLYLHQKGLIAPNTYVIDLDTVRNNARSLALEAKSQNLELYFMTKQFGRNPLVSKAIVEAGISKAVAVDPWEAITLAESGIDIGHVGHLVQVPSVMLDQILDLNPDQITVFSYENAKFISEKALKRNRKQSIILRVVGRNDFVYPGQEGGIPFEKFENEVEKIEKLPGVIIRGVTSFPCLLAKDGEVSPTPNFHTINKAAAVLRDKGYERVEVNAPSVSTTNTLQLIKENGGTQGEPGHAFTGTTPLHISTHHPERPAMIYVSEVSHKFNDLSYVFGGGFYARSHVQHALVGKRITEMAKVNVIPANPENIDYYGTLQSTDLQVGDTALFSFRTQVFVKNSQVVIVENLESNPKILGVFNSGGRR